MPRGLFVSPEIHDEMQREIANLFDVRDQTELKIDALGRRCVNTDPESGIEASVIMFDVATAELAQAKAEYDWYDSLIQHAAKYLSWYFKEGYLDYNHRARKEKFANRARV